MLARRDTLVPVHIERLTLTDFRNYESLRLDLDRRHVVLTGENGAGKTNLLEAVSFLSPGRGLRRAPYPQVAREGGGGTWTVHVKLEGAGGPASIGTGLQIGPGGVETQRRVSVNGAAAKTSDALQEHTRVVWLTPAMDGLFTGAKGDRRRFLDRLVLAIDPLHGRRVADYEKAMRGRNRLLSEGQGSDQWLGSIEAELARLGVDIAAARARLIALLRETVDETSAAGEGVFPDAVLAIEGELENAVTEGAEDDLAETLRAQFAKHRGRDRLAGRTLDGPHRSDLIVHHGPKGMAAALCSTGEQKALLTGIVLAHARLVGRVAKMAPLLLLDEIAAHLDPHRRAALFDVIDALGCQAWMTGTDDHLFDAMGERAQHFAVSDATVTAR